MAPKKRTTVLAALGGLGAAGVLGFALAGSPAQAEDPSPSPSSSTPAAGTDKPDRDAFRAQRQDELAAGLATELGIDKAKVAAALQKVQAAQQSKAQAGRTAELKTRLDAAVTAGKLTKEQAAAILKAAESGVLMGPGGHGGGWGGPGGRHGR